VIGLDENHPFVGRSASFRECADTLRLRRIDWRRSLNDNDDVLLLQAIVTPISKTFQRELITVLDIPWLAILDELHRDPSYLYRFSEHDRGPDQVAAKSPIEPAFEISYFSHTF